MKKQSGVLASFANLDDLTRAIADCRKEGRDDLSVYTPCPRHEIDHAMHQPTSPVRLWTLFGGLFGVSAGYVFTSYASLDWILPTSGKEIVSIPAFTVPAFEATILFGSILTITGIVLFSKLFRSSSEPYSERFSDDRFGLFLPCREADRSNWEALLVQHGAEEVNYVA
jgi:molybdopterin-containing oxidoreductase family membrane subunit